MEYSLQARVDSYGELGAMIIFQTLRDTFPPDFLTSEKASPLPVVDFIQKILVPEVGVALIREDMKSDFGNALKTLRESSSYGAAMFPVTDSDEAEGVMDKLMKKRVRAKRKVLEEEDPLNIAQGEISRKLSRKQNDTGERLPLPHVIRPKASRRSARINVEQGQR